MCVARRVRDCGNVRGVSGTVVMCEAYTILTCVLRGVSDWRPDPPMPSSRALPSGILTCVLRGVSETGARTLPCPAAERCPVVYLHVCCEACQGLW